MLDLAVMTTSETRIGDIDHGTVFQFQTVDVRIGYALVFDFLTEIITAMVEYDYRFLNFLFFVHQRDPFK